jgi:WD domain, G-beta repeat
MRPGEVPLEALAAAITRLWQLDAKDPDQAARPRKWAKGLSAGDNNLADLLNVTQDELKKREGEAPERILLYVDQGEELYTRATHRDAKRFSEVLTEGLDDPRLCAFASMRSDYFGRLQADEPLFKCHEHINVPPLDRAQLHEVVTAPARALGVIFEDGQTASRITAAAAAEPGALPLLSYLLTDMWAAMVRRGDPTLRLPAAAIDLGGVLASRAEEFLKAHPDEENSLHRLLTLKLASVPPEGEPIRRQTTDEECSEAEWTLACRLAEYPWRLVVIGDREVDKRVVAEVAHEALLSAWPRLADWLRKERDFLIFKGDAERAERRWRGMARSDAALLTGLDITRAEGWLPTRSEDLSREVTAFVRRSLAVDRAAKERRLRFQRSVSIGTVAAALLMTAVGGFAWFQWGQANRAKLFAQRTVTSAAFSSDGKRMVTPAGENVMLWDAETGESIGLLSGHADVVLSAAFSPEGKRIVTASFDKTARLWDAETGEPIGKPLTGHLDVVLSAAFSPEGKRIVTASWDKTARLWDAETGEPIGEPLKGHADAVFSAAFSPDGKRIVTASSGHRRLWDSETGKLIRELQYAEWK